MNVTRRAPRGAAPTLNDKLYGLVRAAVAPLRRAPWWLKVALLYLAARLVSFAILSGAAWHAEASPWGGRQPGYLTFIDRWDAGWYERIFDGGYPSSIPRNAAGAAEPNQWAFYPLFPALVRCLHLVTGLSWDVAAPLSAGLAGLAAALMIYKLFRVFATPDTALWGVAFFATFPISPILQVGYAESLSAFLLAAALFALIRRKYWSAVPIVVLLCLTRPIGVPFAAVVGVHLMMRWWQRRTKPFPVSETVAGMSLLAVSTIMAFAWVVVAAVVTGDSSAYTDTELAWRGGPLVLFIPWITMGVYLLGPFWGPVVPVLLVVFAGLFLNSHSVRRLGPELRLWCAMYLLYLLAVLQPQSSTFRLLLPLFPLALAAAFISKSRAYRWSVIVMFTLLQIVWVVWLWQYVAINTGMAWPP